MLGNDNIRIDNPLKREIWSLRSKAAHSSYRVLRAVDLRRIPLAIQKTLTVRKTA
jgi:hypothetical protein